MNIVMQLENPLNVVLFALHTFLCFEPEILFIVSDCHH